MLRIGIFGDRKVGKSSFVDSLLGKKFNEKHTSGGGCIKSFFAVRNTGDSKEEKRKTRSIQLAEYTGKDCFRKQKFEMLDGAILIFDINNISSLEVLQNLWLPVVRARFGKIPVILVGTKCDLKRMEKMPNFSGKYYETSSKNNKGTKEAFFGLLQYL